MTTITRYSNSAAGKPAMLRARRNACYFDAYRALRDLNDTGVLDWISTDGPRAAEAKSNAKEAIRKLVALAYDEGVAAAELR